LKIAITGGKGFIGSAAADAAEAAGHDVVFFDRRDGHNILGDLSGLSGADAVVHLAGVIGTAELFDDVEEAISVNVNGAYRVMTWCLQAGAQYVGIGCPDAFPSIYNATKQAAARLASALHLAKGLRCSHVVAYNAHGPGQAYGVGHPQKFAPTFAIKAWGNRPIPVWGDGTSTVDAVRVRDVGRMLIDACHHDDDAVFDAGTGTGITVRDVADFVLHVTGSTAGVVHLPMRLGETPTNIAATGRGWDRLDWRPEFRWDDLRDTIGWYRTRDYVDLSGTR
jgi:UDP-glucose 4-epimerase